MPSLLLMNRPLNYSEPKWQMKKILAKTLWTKLLRSWELRTGFVGDMSSWLPQKDEGFSGPVAWRRAFCKEQKRCPKKGLIQNSGVVSWGSGDAYAPMEKQARMPTVLKLTTPVSGLPRTPCIWKTLLFFVLLHQSVLWARAAPHTESSLRKRGFAENLNGSQRSL